VLPEAAIERTLENPTPPMPSYRDLPEQKKADLVAFLAQLKGEGGDSEAGGSAEGGGP
jgi:menaquinol-cytochrome c reductase cytochrome b/c subunit